MIFFKETFLLPPDMHNFIVYLNELTTTYIHTLADLTSNAKTKPFDSKSETFPFDTRKQLNFRH